MLRLRTVVGATGAALVVMTAAHGCTSDVHSQAGGTDTASSAGGASGAQVTSSGKGGATPASSTVSSIASTGAGGNDTKCGPYDGLVFAVNELFLGDRSFTKVKSSTAWMDFGFNLDGQATASDFSQHCKPYNGGSTSSFQDGSNGRDNSFGRNIRPIVEPLLPDDIDTMANAAIDSGSFTEIFTFEKLGMMPDVAPLAVRLYGGGDMGSSPLWNGKDCWPVVSESLIDQNDVLTAKVIFPNAKLTNDVFDSNGVTNIVLPINILGQTVSLRVYHVRISAQFSKLHDGIALGQLGGFVKTEEFVQTLKQAAGAVNMSNCGLFDLAIANQIRQASDMIDDGKQDPNKTCNAISVGIGFTMLPISFGKISPPAQPVQNPCP
jgi:hypothetical protein